MVQAYPGGVPMFFVSGPSLVGRAGVYLYQRDDGGWQPVFPADAGRIGDTPAVIALCFPELVR